MAGKALMSLFVLASKDGWVNIMYTGLDAVGVDMQVTRLLCSLDLFILPPVYRLVYFPQSSPSR